VFSLSRQLSSPDFLYFIAIPRFYLYFSQKKIASRKAPLFSDKLNKEFFNRLGLLAAVITATGCASLFCAGVC
jgi:hypothetical protein